MAILTGPRGARPFPRPLLRGVVVVLTVEKMLQHGLTALFFLGAVPGVGTPDIGDRIRLSSPTMAFLNVLYLAAFALALTAFVSGRPSGRKLILWLAALDILLEFLFHGFFFLTVSVLVSTALIVCLTRLARSLHGSKS